jgi:hypothetical protein
MMKALQLTVACALFVLVACGGSTSPSTDVLPKDPGPGVDILVDDTPITPEDAVDDVTRDLIDPDATPADVPAEDVPALPREFGYPCTENAQCNAGFCLDSPRGRICTSICVENCPQDWTCKNLSVGGETVSICVPLYLNICDPCGATKDCNGELTGGTAICIDKGTAGKFCGADCAISGVCPSGYECKDTEDGAGGVARQCVPAGDGQCQCSARAISQGLLTECFVANDTGMCKGARRCLINGLTACDARTPREEDCNGLDDDCNGLTDELQGKFPCTKSNEFGSCTGSGDCISGGVANCDARTPAKEQCNGIDDNCDGQTDEGLCYDGNPCTKDLCDSGSGQCVFEPYQGPCDDLNPCTVNDHCDVTGQCVAGGTKNCDDLNPCTDDGCDAGSGGCIHLNNTSPCDDGNFCTQNDSCQSSICRGGATKDCMDDNVCTMNERCNPANGACISDPNNGIPCDDGNGCTINDTCSGGSCVAPGDWCDANATTCVPPPGKTICLAPKCVLIPIVNLPTCPCICI